MLSDLCDCVVMLGIECIYRGLLLFEYIFNYEYDV